MSQGVQIVIPPKILPALKRPTIDPLGIYSIALPDGRLVIASGKEWVAVGAEIVRLAGALEWGGEATVRRFARQLRGAPSQ